MINAIRLYRIAPLAVFASYSFFTKIIAAYYFSNV